VVFVGVGEKNRIYSGEAIAQGLQAKVWPGINNPDLVPEKEGHR